jgi:hypothetical protein
MSTGAAIRVQTTVVTHTVAADTGIPGAANAARPMNAMRMAVHPRTTTGAADATHIGNPTQGSTPIK